MSSQASTLSDRPGTAPKLMDLDASVIAHSKAQIGELVAEIAELASSSEAPDAFYSGMLTRLVTAMAGSGAGVWQRFDDGHWQLLHARTLPESLTHRFDSPSSLHGPSLEHSALLECVAREQQPILVPPGDIASNANRPVNPLQQCLIYSPIPVETGMGKLWLQVVQPPSGGVATQRGYLRFVAQIADLTADFLKSYRLRQFKSAERLFSASDQLLHQATRPGESKLKLNVLLEQVRELTEANQIILVQRGLQHSRWKIAAATGLNNVDTRSPGSRCVAELCSWVVQQSSVRSPRIFTAPEKVAHASTSESSSNQLDVPIQKFCDLFSAIRLAWLPIFGATRDRPQGVVCLVVWSDSDIRTRDLSNEAVLERAQTLTRLGLNAIRPPRLKNAIVHSEQQTGKSRRLFQTILYSRWIRAGLVSGALIAIGLVPVPLRMVAPATLQPAIQHRHYAPMDARIHRVHVEYGQSVTEGQLLLELEDRQLSKLLDDATSQQVKSSERRREIEARLLRGDRLANDIRNELEGELELLRRLVPCEQARIEELQSQMDLLTIRAAQPGVVATWNTKELLQDRPVRVGQLLLQVQQADGPWVVEARVPQREVGKFLKLIQQGPLTAHCTLTSHPNQRIPAIYQPVNSQAIFATSRDRSEVPSLSVRFAVPFSELPQQNAGSTANVIVDIGRGPLVWSAFGDAITFFWTKVRLWI